jgi:cell division protein FtsI (penicillin-binding protein 3)
MAFGYGVSVTPMQTLTFYNAVANNGVMVKPQFVSEIKEGTKPL